MKMQERLVQLIEFHRAKSEEFQCRAMQCDHPITQAFLSGQAAQHGQWAKDIEFLRGPAKEEPPVVDTE